MFRMVPFSIPRNNLFLFSLFSSKEVDRFVLVGIILLGFIRVKLCVFVPFEVYYIICFPFSLTFSVLHNNIKKNRKIRYFSVKP
jgi:hypothetical protein